MAVGDHWELLLIGVDAALLLLLRQLYKNKIAYSESIENTPSHEPGEDLKSALQEAPNKCIEYGCVEGVTKDKGAVLTSQYVQGEQGLLQRLLYIEHQSKRGRGHWTDVTKILRHQVKSKPFGLVSAEHPGGLMVDVGEPVEADFLLDDIPITYDRYEPTSEGVLSRSIDRLFGEITKGYQETEQMLGVGVPLLGVGKITLSGSDKILLGPPTERGRDFILTTMSKKQLVSYLREEAKKFKVMLWIFGLLGAGLLSVYLYKKIRAWLERSKFEKMYKDLRKKRAESRRARDSRRSTTNGEGGEGQQQEDEASSNCVVCLENPRGVVILECGHICVCEDCAELLPSPKKCPICRGPVSRYLSTYNA